MKIAILSDIHGNLEALLAVLLDLGRRKVDRTISLGDNIGYGPDPDGVVQQLRAAGVESTLGNHELALYDGRARQWMNFLARENNIVTAQMLSEESLAYCTTLPSFLAVGRGYCTHGFPPASVCSYLNRQPDAKLLTFFEATAFQVVFVGHTHELQVVYADKAEWSTLPPQTKSMPLRDKEKIVRCPLTTGSYSLKPERKYFINAGSVGQPRDGDCLAKYIIWDDDAATVEVVAVDYDYKTTMDKIRSLGFPDSYAQRLAPRT